MAKRQFIVKDKTDRDYSVYRDGPGLYALADIPDGNDWGVIIEKYDEDVQNLDAISDAFTCFSISTYCRIDKVWINHGSIKASSAAEVRKAFAKAKIAIFDPADPDI